uniref:Uncharacterized protein n=1 Tax=Ditylenchus dipsaci TaxID=166011 RepID=A0A915EB63_9BILA
MYFASNYLLAFFSFSYICYVFSIDQEKKENRKPLIPLAFLDFLAAVFGMILFALATIDKANLVISSMITDYWTFKYAAGTIVFGLLTLLFGTFVYLVYKKAVHKNGGVLHTLFLQQHQIDSYLPQSFENEIGVHKENMKSSLIV